jgi:hypothetical protein
VYGLQPIKPKSNERRGTSCEDSESNVVDLVKDPAR